MDRRPIPQVVADDREGPRILDPRDIIERTQCGAELQFTLGHAMVAVAVVAAVLAVSRFPLSLAIPPLAIGGYVFLVNWKARNGRPRAQGNSGDLVFNYGWAVRIVAMSLVVGIFAIGGLATYEHPAKNATELSLLCVVFGFFLIPVGTLLWEAMRFSIVVSGDGLHFRSAWRRGFFVAWPEITEVFYDPAMWWFVIRSSQGQTIHVSRYVAGIGKFVGEVTRRLQPSGLREPNAPGFVIFKRSLP